MMFRPYSYESTNVSEGGGHHGRGAGVKELMLAYCRPVLLNKDPLQIDVLYTRMIAQGSGAGLLAGAPVTAASGVEIALWDLARKILGSCL
jgi:galactonate dehydratase/gluconate/galactonate dehydratase